MFNSNINNYQINRLNMAECALIKSSQCFQDKNRIKKDLTKLTKNLLLLVGLERVAQELVGGRRWRKLTAPFNSLEPDEIQDWNPSDICYFCNSDKHDSNHNEILKHNDDCPLSTSTVTDSSQLQSLNQPTQQQPTTSCSCLPSISNGSDTNIPINIPINIPVVQASANIKSVTAISNVNSEQPLDLSLHSRSALIPEDKSTNHISDTSSSSSLLRIPQPNQTNTKQGKKNRLETTATTTTTSTSSNWKRAYTEEELQQALNDIQSGKLGTRRAAVIYGIPRSTLRNKVYKLSSDRLNVKRGQGSTTSNSTVQPTAASSTGSTGSAFNTAKLSTNLPACAAVAVAAAAAAAAAANTTNIINPNSTSSSTTTSGNANLLHGRKSILPIRNNGKESAPRKSISTPRRSLKQPVNDETETLESGLSSPVIPKNIDSHFNDNTNEEDNDDDKNNILNNSSNLIPNDLKQFLKRTITQRAANSKPLVPPGIDSFPSLDPSKLGADITNMGSTMPNIFTDPLTTLQILSAMDGGNSIGPLISQILLNVHAFPLANSVNNLINSNHNLNYNNKPTENMDLNNSLSGTLPLLPELIRKLAQERLEAERLSGLIETQERSTDGSCDRNVILKVPSYQPKLSLDVLNKNEDINNNVIKQEGPTSNNSNIGGQNNSSSSGVSNLSSHSLGDLNINMVKDENNNGLNEKRFKLFPVNSDESSSDALINENAKNYNFNRRKVEKRNPTDTKQTSDQSAPSTPDLKRNRPKRGRYRNYKRDDLARAVKAVQLGEMSVHRAGTHFGVPHSTLEYKVKERHLLRPKKRQTTSTSGAASLIKKEDGQSLILPKSNLTDPLVLAPGTGPLNPKPAGLVTIQQPQPQPQQPQPMEGLSMVNQVNHASLWQSALPLFPLDFGTSQNSTNFFASNMMRKLKENAQLHEETFNNNSNGSTNANNVSGFSDSNSMGPTGLKDREFGSLLLETLIKSSLERKMLNTMSSANSDSDSRLNRNTSSSVPYRFHNED